MKIVAFYDGTDEFEGVLTMHHLAERLVDYVINKGMVEEKERELYKYGFLIGMEILLFFLFCSILTIYMKMFIEGIMFFVVFSPLRAYAGGLHLKKYRHCFLCSCFIYFIVLVFIKYFHAPSYASFVFILFMEFTVYVLYPVENKNRVVDRDEDRYFRGKLLKFLIFHFWVALFCQIAEQQTCLFEMAFIYFIVVLTMLAGKLRNYYERNN